MNKTTPTIKELKEALKNAEKSEHKHMVELISAQIEIMETETEKPKNLLKRIFAKRSKK
jgi:hypothetical protein